MPEVAAGAAVVWEVTEFNEVFATSPKRACTPRHAWGINIVVENSRRERIALKISGLIERKEAHRWPGDKYRYKSCDWPDLSKP